MNKPSPIRSLFQDIREITKSATAFFCRTQRIAVAKNLCFHIGQLAKTGITWYLNAQRMQKTRHAKNSGRNEELHGGRDLMRFVKSSSRTSHMKLRTAQSCLLLVAKNLNFTANTLNRSPLNRSKLG